MLNFRYHALSIVAVFLALAIGLLLGVAIGDRGLVSSAEHDVRASLRERERYEDAAYPAMVAGRLEGMRLALIELGGGSDRMWDLTRAALEGSGARLVSVSVIRRPLDREALASAAGGTRYERLVEDPSLVHPFGARLGIQFATGGELLDRVRRELLVQGSGALDGADGVVLVRSEPPELDEEEVDLLDAFEDGLVRGLGAFGAPVVGVEATDAEPSQVPWFKAHELSSVDDLDDRIGRAALVFALAGQRGSFGVKPTADGGRLPPVVQ